MARVYLGSSTMEELATAMSMLRGTLGVSGEDRADCVIADACREIVRLQDQVTSLQAANTAEVERRRAAERDATRWRALAAGIREIISEVL